MRSIWGAHFIASIFDLYTSECLTSNKGLSWPIRTWMYVPAISHVTWLPLGSSQLMQSLVRDAAQYARPHIPPSLKNGTRDQKCDVIFVLEARLKSVNGLGRGCWNGRTGHSKSGTSDIFLETIVYLIAVYSVTSSYTPLANCSPTLMRLAQCCYLQSSFSTAQLPRHVLDPSPLELALGGLGRRIKLPGHSPPSFAKVNNGGAVPPLPHTSSWLDAQLSPRTLLLTKRAESIVSTP
jgi:hypothetical protein